MFLIVLWKLIVSIVKLRPLKLTKQEVELGADWPVTLPYLKAAVTISKGTCCAVLFYTKYINKKSF